MNEGEFLAKREKSLSIHQKHPVNCHESGVKPHKHLLQLLGLDSGDLTITQLKQLSRMALLCFAEDKPEPQWFDAKYLEQVQETVGKAKQLYQEHNLLKSRLDETYTDGIYDLDLDALIANYSGPYQSGMKLFNSDYRNDQKQIAKVTNDGKVPKDSTPRPNRRPQSQKTAKQKLRNQPKQSAHCWVTITTRPEQTSTAQKKP